MKKASKLNHSKFSTFKNGWLLLLIAFIAMVISGCKKGFSPPCDNKDFSKGKSKDLIVHKGSSIQKAVDAASPGQTIWIEAGTYNEAVSVKKPNISLIGLSCFAFEKVIISLH